MNEIGLIVDGDQYTVIFNETLETYTFTNEHCNFDDLMECVSAQDTDGFLDLFTVVTQLQESIDSCNTSDSTLKIVNGNVEFNGQVLHSDVTDKLLEFYEKGLDYNFLVKFIVRLQKNPSKQSVDQLFKFLQHKNLAIGPDGRFWAYKTVRSDYKDKYSGKFNNSIGSICRVPRNTVDDNPNNHCSHGFHVGSLEYAGPGGWYNSSGDRVMIVAVDPADAVSVPNDHSFQKLRVCEYEVIGEYKQPLNTVETTRNSIGGVDIDPYDLETGDVVEVSVEGVDFEGRITDSDGDLIVLMGRSEDGYFDEFEFYREDIDAVRYL
jgi:hypothetical protein